MTHETTTPTQQTTVGDRAGEQEHVHPAQVHVHDHYHVTHHHTGGGILGGEFEHRSAYHSHEHNHAPLVHGHEHEPADERPSEFMTSRFSEPSAFAALGPLGSSGRVPAPPARKRRPLRRACTRALVGPWPRPFSWVGEA